MSIALTINDVAVDMHEPSGLNVSWRLGARGTAEFAILDPDSEPVVGQKVGIYDNGVRKFGGIITEIRRELISSPSDPKILYHCLAVSWEIRLDYRLVRPPQSSSDPSSTYIPLSGVCDVSGTSVVRVSGDPFDQNLKGVILHIAGNPYIVASVTNENALTLESSAGTLSGASWQYVNTPGNIARSIIANFAAGEPIQPGTIEEGPEITRLVCDHVRISDVFDELATRANKIWYLGPDLQFNLVDRATVTAPEGVTTSNALREGYEVRETSEDLTNAHYRRISFNAFSPNESVFVGDGSTKTFYLDNPPNTIQTITLQIPSEGLVEESTFGVRGVDTGKDFYWAPGEKKITQDDTYTGSITNATNDTPIEITTSTNHGLASGHTVVISGVTGNTAANGRWRIEVTADNKFQLLNSSGSGTYTGGGTVTANAPLGNGDVLTVVYRRLGGDVVSHVDTAAISERAAIEGMSGRYETVEDEPEVTDAGGTLALCEAIVDARKDPQRIVTFRTEVKTFAVGQLLSITNDVLGCTDTDYLIDEMSMEAHGNRVIYTVQAVDGRGVGGWREYFRALAGFRNQSSLVTISGGTTTGGTGTGGGGGTPEAPNPPENVTVAILYPDDRQFSISVAWTKPNPAGGTIGYTVEVRYFDSADATTPISGWIRVGNPPGLNTETDTFGPFPKPAARAYVLARVYGRNANDDLSLPTTSSTPAVEVEAIASELTPPTQPSASDWSVAVPEYRNGQSGVQYAHVVVTISNPASDAESYDAWYSETDSLNPSDYQHLAVGAKSTPPFTITSWRERPTTTTTWYVILTASKAGYHAVPDDTAIANRKPVTVIGIASPQPPISFTVSVDEDNTGAQIAGQRAGRYAWQVVLPADPQRRNFSVFRRFATDGTFTVFSSAWIEEAVGGLNNQTAHTELLHSGWWPWPTQGEWHQWKVVVYGLDGSSVETATQNITLNPGGGLKLDQADPSTVGGGLAVIGGALVSLSRNGLQNGDFEYQLNGWNIANTAIADSSTKFAGVYAARVPGNGVDWNTVYQVLPTQPGQVWRMTCRVRNETNAPIFPNIVFWRADGNLTTPIVQTSVGVPVQSGTWQTVTVVSGTAPSDAAFVKFSPLETNSTNTSGFAWADSVEVDLVTSVAASGGPLENVTALAPNGEPTTNGIPTFYIFGSWTPETPTPQRTYVTASLIYPSSAPITLGRYSIQAGVFDTDRWPRPKTNRSATVRLTVTSQDGVLGASVDVPITIAAGPSGTLDLSTANPSTIGNGLWLDGSKIGSVTSDVSNAAPNGDFEQGVHGQPPPGWTVNEPSRVFIDNSLSHSGSNCVSLSGGTPEARLISAAIPCKAGESWYIEGVLRRDNASDGAFSAWVNVYDRLGTLLATEETVGVLAGVPNNAGWVTRTATFTTPLNASTMKIIVRASHSSGLCRVDSIILRRRVISELLADGSVQASKLAAAAVTTQAIANLAVDWSKIANLAVDAAKLADSAVTATKIANAAVGSAAIAAAAIGSAHIANAAIIDAHIANMSVSKLLAGSAVFTGDIVLTRGNASLTLASNSITLQSSISPVSQFSITTTEVTLSIGFGAPLFILSQNGLTLTVGMSINGNANSLVGVSSNGFRAFELRCQTGNAYARGYHVLNSAGQEIGGGVFTSFDYVKPGGETGTVTVQGGLITGVT